MRAEGRPPPTTHLPPPTHAPQPRLADPSSLDNCTTDNARPYIQLVPLLVVWADAAAGKVGRQYRLSWGGQRQH